MKSTILAMSLLLLVQFGTDPIRQSPPVPDPLSVESQFRLYAYLSQFVEICQSQLSLNRAVADVEVVKLRINATSMKGASLEMYEEAVKIEYDVRMLSIKMMGVKAWCDTNKFVLTAHGYGRVFKEQELK
jgi:hypothetical protein